MAHVHVSRDWGHIRRGSRAQAGKELILGRAGYASNMQAMEVSAKQLRRHHTYPKHPAYTSST
jgi:hypothetical protein